MRLRGRDSVAVLIKEDHPRARTDSHLAAVQCKLQLVRGGIMAVREGSSQDAEEQDEDAERGSHPALVRDAKLAPRRISQLS